MFAINAMCAVYPRVCGGTDARRGSIPSPHGLSPRVRGNRVHTVKPNDDAGSIPACAGEPLRRLNARSRLGVYPRVCGGTWAKLVGGIDASGLSPRVRGNLLEFQHPFYWYGSIPACAGEPIWAEGGQGKVTVYPRVCGGTYSTTPIYDQGKGLSPRVRGNRIREVTATTSKGSIPACAGEPPRRRPSAPQDEVYPRVCGGTAINRPLHVDFIGLSPRVRGNPYGVGYDGSSLGSIPACAGEPCTCLRLHGCQRVYPRVCGGTSTRT